MMMLVICVLRQLHPLVDEFGDWREEGLHVRFHGSTNKARDGFLLIEWTKPIPDRFHYKLLYDDDIVDFVLFEHPSPIRATQA